ncbi:enoyl-CoA hydratase/isomerase [Plectosphaerella cucumerina]|uniref:Enoyl-CoA hydratase/isomerase n=1 Tax=Plectosphaerella cucumerina TaxID=40658 RepID=A0A8K0TJ47_9PEZI|nr:enoyl-CoA hydratase/isomerase [Plectosphaerella cucumerina]
MSHQAISVEYLDRIAVITIDNIQKLNALSQQQYYNLAQTLREVAKRDDVFVTVLIGKGRFFSAGADVSLAKDTPVAASDAHKHWLQSFVANNLNATNAFYTHPKILVSALNGPVIGLSAALVAFSDFIYAAPHTYLLTPFSSLGLVSEGGASRALVQRLGISKANEALIMSRRIPASELLATGFVNKIFDEVGTDVGEDEKFKKLVLSEVDDKLGRHLIGGSLLGIKKLIRGPEMDLLDQQNTKEVFAGLERFAAGIPQEEFRKLASGEKRHKL